MPWGNSQDLRVDGTIKKETLTFIQHRFLLNITACHITSTSNFQIIIGILPSSTYCKERILFIKLSLLGEVVSHSNSLLDPKDFDEHIKCPSIHPANLNIEKKILNSEDSEICIQNSICTDGSKTDDSLAKMVKSEWKG
ncbi:hypothetical protein AVEN_76065-1 [Araneus ventricosus]|uniref:Uncharacterized protein n=1 Tax=Araneus ventricosus TaxID=182803 RepID=A0A4Y2LV58_ARAVE|nr:hypothetical protein AVEN_61030-1 [Araneus ventricosus]GBN17273.1 hypothetical protein AVEN_76065-1 [Araneus ventricosus]